MTVKLYRVKIEGYVTVTDTANSPSLTPANWPIESLVDALTSTGLGERIAITETLVDTIEDID